MMEILKEKGVCCISGKPMSTSDHVNVAILDYAPSWEFPFMTNLLMPDQPKRAVAIIHDDHYPATKKYLVGQQVKFAIELRGEEIIYHDVNTLTQIRYTEEN